VWVDGRVRVSAGAKEEASMFVSILGDRRATLPANWTKETIVLVLGDARIDASAGAGTGAKVTFLALAGEAVIRVPAGSRVTSGGFSLLGDREIDVSPGEGPEIRVNAYSLFGDLQVSDRA
jgi:hypothetical protein